MTDIENLLGDGQAINLTFEPGPLEPWQKAALSALGLRNNGLSGANTYTSLREANRARQAEWDKDAAITPAYRGNELAGEVGEACNVIKKLERERLGIAGSRSDVTALAAELADVLICADLIAMHYDIDLEVAVTRKFNATSAKVGLLTRLDLLSAGERCMACDRVLVPGDPIYDDASGGTLHAGCCGPERESYTLGGDPLGPDDAIPEPDIWTLDGHEPSILTRDQFLVVLAHRLIHRAGLSHDYAAQYAVTILDAALDSEQLEYAETTDRMGWDATSARELADEELSSWEG